MVPYTLVVTLASLTWKAYTVGMSAYASGSCFKAIGWLALVGIMAMLMLMVIDDAEDQFGEDVSRGIIDHNIG